MSETKATKPSIYDGLPVVMPCQLLGKRVKGTIERVETSTIKCSNGDEKQGFRIHFAGWPKPLEFVSKTGRKQLAKACGGDDYTQYAGKLVYVTAVETKVGESWRFAAVEG